MTDVLEAINRNAPAVSLLFSLVVAAATVFYALLTRALVKETRRMREVQTEPSLSLSVEPSDHGVNFLNLVIRNVGQGSASAVALRAEPNFQRSKGQHIGDLGLFKYGLKHLAPGQRITVFLTSILDEVHGSGDDLSRLNFTIHASYQSSLGRTYSDSFPIHFESLEGFGSIGTPPLISIADDLSKIQRDVGHLTSGFKRLEVVTQTRADLVQENEERLARQRERQKTRGAKSKPPSPAAVDEVSPADEEDGDV